MTLMKINIFRTAQFCLQFHILKFATSINDRFSAALTAVQPPVKIEHPAISYYS